MLISRHNQLQMLSVLRLTRSKSQLLIDGFVHNRIISILYGYIAVILISHLTLSE